MTQRVREGFFLEEILTLEQNVICSLIFYSPVVCEPPDDKGYTFVRRSIRWGRQSKGLEMTHTVKPIGLVECLAGYLVLSKIPTETFSLHQKVLAIWSLMFGL